MTPERADHVAANLPPSKTRQVTAGRGLQISDGRHGQDLSRRQFGRARRAQILATRRPDRWRETRLGAQLKAAGIEAEPPNDLSRPLDLDGKRDMVRFRNIMLPKLALPETMQFVCTHITPELTRARREWQLHPNGATGVAEIIIAAEDIAAAKRELAPAELSNAATTVATSTDIASRFGKAAQGAPKTGIVAIVIRVNEPDAATAMLDMAKVPHQETRNSVIVPASAAHGVVVEFAEQ